MADINRLVEREKVGDAEPTDGLPTVDELLSSSNWETRVAAARASREKVLAAKKVNLKAEPATDDRTLLFPASFAESDDAEPMESPAAPASVRKVPVDPSHAADDKTLPFLAAFIESEDAEPMESPAAPTSVLKMLNDPAPAAPVVPLSVAKPEPAKLDEEADEKKGTPWPLLVCAGAASFAVALGAGIMIGKGLGSTSDSAGSSPAIAKTDLPNQTTSPEPAAKEPTTTSATPAPVPATEVSQKEPVSSETVEVAKPTPEVEAIVALAEAQNLDLVTELNPSFGIGAINSPTIAGSFAAAKLADSELVSPDPESVAKGPARAPFKLTLASAQDASPELLPAYLPTVDLVDEIIEPGTIAATQDLGAAVPGAFTDVSRITQISFTEATDLVAELPEFVSTSSGPAVEVSFASPTLPLPAGNAVGQRPSATPDRVLAFAPHDALSPPGTDPWSGVKTEPLERATTLAAKLGFVGADVNKVNLHLQAPNGLDQSTVDAQSQALEETGFALAKVARPGFTVSKSHLRYYNASDYEVAQAIASSMGYELRDFTSTKAPTGLVEVWLKGRPDAKAKASSSGTKKRRVDPVTRLRNSLANQLRNGDHL